MRHSLLLTIGLAVLFGSAAQAQPVPQRRLDGLNVEPREQFLGPFRPLVLDDEDVVIGLVRVVRPPSTAMPVVLKAMDAATLEERWSVEGVGDALADIVHIYTRLSRHDDTVIVAQSNRVVRGLALEDGAERWSVQLTDMPRALCVLDGKAYVDLIDETLLRIDPGSGESAVVEAVPDGCVTPGESGPIDRQGRPIRSTVRTEAPSDGLLVAGLARDATLGLQGQAPSLALLHKAPGTSVPYVAGVREGDKLAWRRALDRVDRFAARPEPPAVVALTDSIAVVAYRRRMGQTRVQAIDLATGRDLWDVAPPHAEHGVETLTITDTHVLVGHWTYLESLDLRTGAATGSYGTW